VAQLGSAEGGEADNRLVPGRARRDAVPPVVDSHALARDSEPTPEVLRAGFKQVRAPTAARAPCSTVVVTPTTPLRACQRLAAAAVHRVGGPCARETAPRRREGACATLARETVGRLPLQPRQTMLKRWGGWLHEGGVRGKHVTLEQAGVSEVRPALIFWLCCWGQTPRADNPPGPRVSCMLLTFLLYAVVIGGRGGAVRRRRRL
jgi:hypothetical protein